MQWWACSSLWSFFCGGRLRNLWSDCSTASLYCATITWQQILKGSIQIMVEGVLLHETRVARWCGVWLIFLKIPLFWKKVRNCWVKNFYGKKVPFFEIPVLIGENHQLCNIYQKRTQTLKRKYSLALIVVIYHSDHPPITARPSCWCCDL